MAGICCKPVVRHTKCLNRGLQNVTSKMIKTALKQNITLKAGEKVCRLCARAIFRGTSQPFQIYGVDPDKNQSVDNYDKISESASEVDSDSSVEHLEKNHMQLKC